MPINITKKQATEIVDNRVNSSLQGISGDKGGRAWLDGEWCLDELEALCVLVRDEAGGDAIGAEEIYDIKKPCDILSIKRTDEYAITSRGNNISIVIASDSYELTEELIMKYLIKDKNDKQIELHHNGEVLTREHIEITKLGSSYDIKPGLISEFEVSC